MNHLCHSHLANNVLVEKAMIAILRLFPHCVPRTHLDKSNCSRVSLFKDYQSKKNVPRATERYYRSNKKLLPEQQKSNTRATKNITRATKKTTRATKKYYHSDKKILPEQQKDITRATKYRLFPSFHLATQVILSTANRNH